MVLNDIKTCPIQTPPGSSWKSDLLWRLLLLVVLVEATLLIIFHWSTTQTEVTPSISRSMLTSGPLAILFRGIARFERECQFEPETDWFEQNQNQNLPQLDLTEVALPNYTDPRIEINNVTEKLYPYTAYGWWTIEPGWNSVSNTQYQVVIVSIVEIAQYCSPKKRPSGETLQCASSDEDQIVTREVNVDCVPEVNPRDHHQAALLRCTFDKRINSVRILSQSVSGEVKKSQPILVQHDDGQSRNETTICMRALYGTLDIINILEFHAYYHTQGITRFNFYYYPFLDDDTKQARTARRFISFLSTLPGVELYQFPLSPRVKVHAGGQLVTEHDCLLRHRQSVQIHIDYDEFITTNKNDELLTSFITDQVERRTSSVVLLVANRFYCHEFNLQSSDYFLYSLIMQPNRSKAKTQFYRDLNESTIKRATLLPNNLYGQEMSWFPFRSKMILLRPRLVQHLGVHNVDTFVPFQSLLLGRVSTSGSCANNQTYRLGVNTQAIVPTRKLDASITMMRHFRWCCTSVNQGPIYHPVDDRIVLYELPTKVKQQQTRVESLVLRHFRQFRSKIT